MSKLSKSRCTVDYCLAPGVAGATGVVSDLTGSAGVLTEFVAGATGVAGVATGLAGVALTGVLTGAGLAGAVTQVQVRALSELCFHERRNRGINQNLKRIKSPLKSLSFS